ncbi:GntR family transcriptional regulator [Pseudomonas sp. GB2N2]
MNSFASPQTLVALPYPAQTDDLCSRVFDAILEQRLHAGSRFTEESLAQMFNVRRSDMRGVLTQLSHQQVIVLRTHHRPRVALLDCEQIQQTLHARRLAETTVVRLACQRARPRDLECLRGLIESERRCTARGAAIRLAGAFHLQLAEMAGNTPLAHFLGSLVPLTSLAIAQFDVRVVGYCDWQVHEEILISVQRGDALKAEALLHQHLNRIESELLNSRSIPGQNLAAG